MTAFPAGPTEPPRRKGAAIPRAALGVLFLLLALACCAILAADVGARRPALRLVSTLDPAARSPIVKTMSLQEKADLAGAVAAEETLGRAGDPVLRSAPSGRAAQLRAVRDLVLASMLSRPGWAYHRFLLGRAAFELAPDDPTREGWRRWTTAVRLAGEGAPGLDAIWEWLADRYLENWAALSPAERDSALPVLRRAFRDPAFVGQTFASVCSVLPEKAASLLPDEVEPLRAALGAVQREGRESLAATLEARLRSLLAAGSPR